MRRFVAGTRLGFLREEPTMLGTSTASVPTTFPRLSRRARKVVLLFHVLTSVSWVGVDLVMGVQA